MNLNESTSFKGLNDILNNLNLINLPSSLWGIHIDPKYEYLAIIHVCFNSSNLTIDKGIVVQYDNITDKIQANIFLYCKNVSIPEINPIISSISDLCQMIFTIDELKVCTNFQQQASDKNCLITVNSGFDTCVICNDYNYEDNNLNKSQIDGSDSIWQTNDDNLIASSEDVDVVVKQILELEYTSTEQPNDQIPIVETSIVETIHENPQQFKCSSCSKQFGSLSSLTRHEKSHFKIEETSSKDSTHRCSVCGKCFSSQSHLKVHHRKHTGTRPYACQFCNKCFYTNSHLKEHTRLHTGLKPYKCPICNKESSHQSAHQRHVLTHSNLKPNLCNICGKTFCKGYRMEDHLATHSSERPFKCELCSKSFAKLSSLNIHRKTHTGSRPYVCNVCGKRYTTQSNLGTHMKTHTGVKPYECGACPARFIHPRLLRIHQRIHTGEKPYACADCGRAFSKNVHLTVHRRIHTGEKPYVCQEQNCGRAFTTSGNLNAHRKVHHQNIMT